MPTSPWEALATILGWGLVVLVIMLVVGVLAIVAKALYIGFINTGSGDRDER